MRSKNNLKKFQHTGKSPEQRKGYAEMISGKQSRGTSVEFGLKEDFGDTSAIDGDIEEGEVVTDKPSSYKPPYKSKRTQWEEKLPGFAFRALGLILFGLSAWVLYTTFTNSVKLEGQEQKINQSEDDIEANASRLDELDDQVKENSINIQNLKEDVEDLEVANSRSSVNR